MVNQPENTDNFIIFALVKSTSMREIKYIYFEINKIKGWGETEEAIENANALAARPNTNSDGYLSSLNLTERQGFPERSYSSVHQFWVDLEKYEIGKNTSLERHIDTALGLIRQSLRDEKIEEIGIK